MSEQVCVGKYCIVRTQSAGVFAGVVARLWNGEVVVKKARRLWYWAGAASLSELSAKGVSKPKECKFPCVVPMVLLLGAIEIIPCSRAARKSIEAVPVWSAGAHSQ